MKKSARSIKPNGEIEKLDPRRPNELLVTLPEFRAALSRKLRTPLNDIMGFAQLLATSAEAPGQDDSAQQILAAARRLLEIIDRELDDNSTAAGTIDGPRSKPLCEVLYIEDEPANVILVERTLRLRPALQLVHTGTGESGLELARSHLPRLILLDLNLPDIDGGEVLRRLRQEALTASIPVVVISADATGSQIERLLGAGAHDYLTKPFDIQNLLAVIDQILEANVPA